MSDFGSEDSPAQSVELGIDGIEEAVEIGRGGFGIVYRAVEADLGRMVAVKVLTGHFDERSRLRFDRERLAMGSLSSHPNIVTVHRTGFSPAGLPYLVMEYLEGGSLADHLVGGVSMPWPAVLDVGIEIASALQSSHEAGVLHRDVKPGNILMTASGVSKLGDFGIARLNGEPETKSAVITASLAHAPPEVLSGERPDTRSDCYSLASCLFELLAGTPAFASETDESMLPMLARIAQHSPPDLRAAGIPHGFANVLEASMAKEPGLRYQSLADFGGALQAVKYEVAINPIGEISPEVTVVETSAAVVPAGGATTAINSLMAGPALATGAGGGGPMRGGTGQGGTIQGGTIQGGTIQGGRQRNRKPLWIGLGIAALLVVGVLADAAKKSKDQRSDQEARAASFVASASLETSETEPTSSGRAIPTISEPETVVVPTKPTQSSSTTTTPLPTPPPPTTPPTELATTFVNISDLAGGITVNVPSSWIAVVRSQGEISVSTDLAAFDGGQPVPGAYLGARVFLLGEVIDFDAEVTAALVTAGCIDTSLFVYSDGVFEGTAGTAENCTASGAFEYVVVATDPSHSVVVLVAVQSIGAYDYVAIDEILGSVTFDLERLP